MGKILITLNEIKKMVSECVNKVLIENLLINDDPIEYAKLVPSQTGLRTTIYVDDGGAYLRNSHPLVILFRNGYTEDAELIPMTVGQTPSFSLSKEELKISENDLYEIMAFVSNNVKLLIDFANEKVDHLDFYKTIRRRGKNEDRC